MLVTSLGVRERELPLHVRVLVDQRGASTVEYLVLLALLGLGVLFAVREIQAAIASTGGRVSEGVARLSPMESATGIPVRFERLEPRAATGGANAPARDSEKNLLEKYRDVVLDRVDKELNLLRAGNQIVDTELRLGGKVLNRLVPIDSNRFRDAAHSWVLGPYDAAVGVYRDGVEGAHEAYDAVKKYLHGDVAGGNAAAYDFGLRPFKALVGAGAMLIGNNIDALQTIAGQPSGRHLDDGERSAVRNVFGNSIDTDQVRVKEGFQGIWSWYSGRPFVLGNTVNLKQRPDEFMHEMVHVWQHQNGGTDYIPEALSTDGEGPAAYQWQNDVPRIAFENLRPEKQAQFVADAYRWGAFGRDYPHLTADELRAHGITTNPDDYNRYLADAVAKLRTGRGAP